jgi:chemotaxis protein CheD
MHKPAHAIEIFLQPGEVYFGERDTRIRTLLGSCVAVTVWHPGLLVGGMCHYMLPKHPGKKHGALDGRYADEALELMLQGIRNAGTWPNEYQVKLFGGGHMFSAHQAVSKDHVGAKNVEMARVLMKQHGFSACAEHLGDVGHRNIFFDIWSGHVWVRHQPPVACKSGITSNNINGTLCPQ